jgi:hypothetical protein
MWIQSVSLSVRSFNFRKRIKRSHFTVIFGRVGKRKVIIQNTKCIITFRFKMQKIRRAHQGHRNRIFGSLTQLRMRRIYGIRPVVPQLRR